MRSCPRAISGRRKSRLHSDGPAPDGSWKISPCAPASDRPGTASLSCGEHPRQRLSDTPPRSTASTPRRRYEGRCRGCTAARTITARTPQDSLEECATFSRRCHLSAHASLSPVTRRSGLLIRGGHAPAGQPCARACAASLDLRRLARSDLSRLLRAHSPLGVAPQSGPDRARSAPLRRMVRHTA